MAYEQYSNNAQTTCTGSINNSSNPVTFTLASVTGFPTTGNFRIIVDSEIMLVTSINTGTGSVTAARAQEGTSIASHSSGATVTHVLTAGSLAQLVADRNLFGTYANLPTAGVNGRTYRTTDNGYCLIDNGSAWTAWYDGWPVTVPYNDSNWVTENALSSTVSQTTGSLILSTTTSNGGSDKVSARVRPVPGSTPYTLEWWFDSAVGFAGASSVFSRGGPMLYNSTSTACLVWGLSTQGTAWNYTYYSNYNTFSTNVLSCSPVLYNTYAFCRMVDDGTHRNWYFGATPSNVALWYQESRTANLTATHYGIGIDAYSSGVAIELFHIAGG